MAANILLEEIKANRKLRKQIILQPKFIKGNSCGCEIHFIRGNGNDLWLSSPV